MTSTDGDLPPLRSGFTDNLALQLQVVCEHPGCRQHGSVPPVPASAAGCSGAVGPFADGTQTFPSPAQHLTVLAAASWHGAQIPPLLSESLGLLYQPGCFSSGKAQNTRRPCRNHEKLKPRLASKFPESASRQRPNLGTVTA